MQIASTSCTVVTVFFISKRCIALCSQWYTHECDAIITQIKVCCKTTVKLEAVQIVHPLYCMIFDQACVNVSLYMSIISLIVIALINMRELHVVFPRSNGSVHGCCDMSRSMNYLPLMEMNIIYDWHHSSLRSFFNECIPDSSVVKTSVLGT